MQDRDSVAREAAVPLGVEPGRIVASSLKLFASDALPFTALMGLVFVPVIVWVGVLLVTLDETIAAGDLSQQLRLFGWGTVVLALLLEPIASGAIAYGVFKRLRGEPVSAGRALAVGLPQFLPVVGVALASGVLILLGFAALILPGIVLSLAFYVVVPVAIVERLSVKDALRRSHELTRGHLWYIFGAVFLLRLIERVATFVVEEAVLGDGLRPGRLGLYLALTVVVAIVAAAVNAVARALVYYQLRGAGDGDDDDLVAVFE